MQGIEAVLNNCQDCNVHCYFKRGHTAGTAGFSTGLRFHGSGMTDGKEKRAVGHSSGPVFIFAESLTVSQRGETINLANYVQRIRSVGMSAGWMF